MPVDGVLHRFAGEYRLRFLQGPRNEEAVSAAAFKIRLGLQVQEGRICVRDLYDLIGWSVECPAEQRLPFPDGWYRLTVYSSPPPSGLLGDGQTISIHLEPMSGKPPLRWEGVPLLCEADSAEPRPAAD